MLIRRRTVTRPTGRNVGPGTKWTLAFALVVAAASGGCGPGVGSVLVGSATTPIYFDPSDMDKGGDGGRTLDLVARKRAAWIDAGDHYRLLDVRNERVKIQIVKGRDMWATGWLERRVVARDPHAE